MSIENKKNCAVIVETRGIDMDIVRAHMKFLPDWDCQIIGEGISITSMQSYNDLLVSLDFWDKLKEYNRVLIFQMDSMLLRNGIDEFLEWDYVGAPWGWQSHGGNGGLSIRNPRVMMEIIKKVPYKHGWNEDTYFSNALHDLPSVGKLAPRSVCEKFSCETIFKLGTLGYHAIEKYLPISQVNQIKNQYDKSVLAR